MLKTVKNLDELQLIKRGNVFKHGLFSLIGLILFNSLLYACGIEWAPGKWAELTIILFTIVLCSIELICYDIYPLTEERQKFLIYFIGVFGVISIVVCIYDLFAEKPGIIADGKITESVLGIIYGIMFLSIFLVYKLKTRYNSQHEND